MARSNRSCSRTLAAFSSSLALVTFSLASLSWRLAWTTRALAADRASLDRFSSPLARAWTAETAPSPTTAMSTAAPAAVTAVRWRVNQRTSFRFHGSFQAMTDSSAIQRSMSSARALHES